MDKVLIGVPMGEMGRYNKFHSFLSLIERQWNTETGLIVGRSAAENRNIIIEQALAKECTHVLFLDDDMAPEPDILNRLIKHRLPIVTGLYYTRKYPHQPVIFSKFDDDNNVEWYQLEDGKTGLVEVQAAGLGACLVEVHVFENMTKPWVRYGETSSPDSWCHDLGFFRRARRRKYPVWCDLDCHVGHIGEMIIRPDYVLGKWHFTYSTDDKNRMSVPRPPALELV